MVKTSLGEIHVLEVGPQTTPSNLKKLSRRHAMTGGYELSLKQEMSPDELGRLAESFCNELAQRSSDDMQYKTCNAYRILTLLRAENLLPKKWLERLNREVFPASH